MIPRTPRTRTLTLDGASFRLRALTIAEAEGTLRALETATAAGRAEDVALVWRDLVATGLSVDPDDPWTSVRVSTDLDLIAFDALRRSILDFSGLKEAPAEGSPPGEPTASEGSPTSAAA